MFSREYEHRDDFVCTQSKNKLTDIKVWARATITFDFNLNEIEKVKEIFDLVRKDINLHTDLVIDSTVKMVEIEKIREDASDYQ